MDLHQMSGDTLPAYQIIIGKLNEQNIEIQPANDSYLLSVTCFVH